MTTATSPVRVPLVDFLVLEPEPHLVANECTSCSARYFDHRDGCASCFGSDFRSVDIPNEGEVVAFTIVEHARPGVPAPFVAAIVDCGGTWVRANVREIAPDPSLVSLGMPVRLVTYSMGLDAAGTEAIGFGYGPAAPVDMEASS